MMEWQTKTSYQDTLPHGLPPLRLVNRRTQEHVGACPFCGGNQRSDRFHVWMEPGHERYWCRACDAKGPLARLLGTKIRPQMFVRRAAAKPAPPAAPAHQDHYRQIYAIVTLWAHALLLDEANPDPRAYLHQRGLSDETIGRHVLGVTLRDPRAIPELLRRECPELLPYAEEAGVLARDHSGTLRTHPNLCGTLLFPYTADGEVVDLRTRSFPGKGYKSLPGGYSERGAIFPFGWDQLDDSDTIILTEGEFKALAVTQAYHSGQLSLPAIAHPGLSYIREEWAAALRERGVRTIILAYDSGPRPIKDGALQLAPEEIWAIRHGQRLAAAGLGVRVLRLPLSPGQQKSDLDAFLLERGAPRLQHLIDTAPSLRDYYRSLPRSLLVAAKLPLPNSYPTRRARPQRLGPNTPLHTAAPKQSISLDQARADIARSVRDHALEGRGFLVLAHPPGAGKGHNTMLGLDAYQRALAAPGRIVWTALRKEQIRDQEGIALTPLHGRSPANCHRYGEAQVLSAKGYSVRETLCKRHCPFVNHCAYLRQFRQDADFFAPIPLLQATGWWKDAGVLILDEFDPARLTRITTLTSADLAAINRGTTCPHAHAILRWLGLALATASERRLTGGLLIVELAAAAHAEGLKLATTLAAACASLPAVETQLMLSGFPQGASIADYEALPPNYLATIIQRLAHEQRAHMTGVAFNSRFEISGGCLTLFLRIDHLIAQLSDPAQPKVILDATVSAPLMHMIFPDTPIRVERPSIEGGARVVQVITRDWAKSTLRGERRSNWLAEVAAQIRPERPTLVVCTMACEEELRAALLAEGHTQAVVAHYGALRGSNMYKGYDVILAQVYNPNLDAITHEGRALFADSGAPIDEQIITTDRILEDATGARWAIQVTTFRDERLAALLENRREAEMVQCAMRGRPFDHPEAQITLMFGLPLPGLTPTIAREGEISPESNLGRQEAVKAKLIEATRQLLSQGQRTISVADLAAASDTNVGTVRKHWQFLADHLRLQTTHQSRYELLSSGGRPRLYRRMVLTRRGRAVPPQPAPALPAAPLNDLPAHEDWETTDRARNKTYITRVIHRFHAPHRSFYRYETCDQIRTTGPPG